VAGTNHPCDLRALGLRNELRKTLHRPRAIQRVPGAISDRVEQSSFTSHSHAHVLKSRIDERMAHVPVVRRRGPACACRLATGRLAPSCGSPRNRSLFAPRRCTQSPLTSTLRKSCRPGASNSALRPWGLDAAPVRWYSWLPSDEDGTRLRIFVVLFGILLCRSYIIVIR
jgi:hypothetical protein